MLTVNVDLFDALNHFKTTSPWIGIVNIWLTNHSHLRGPKHFSILGRFSHILRQVSDSVIKLSRSVNRFSSKKTQLLSRSLMKTIWPRFAVQRHKKHKGTKNSFHYKTKRVQINFRHDPGMYLWNSKGNFCPYLTKLEFHRSSKQSCHFQLKQHRSRKWIVSYHIWLLRVVITPAVTSESNGQ